MNATGSHSKTLSILGIVLSSALHLITPSTVDAADLNVLVLGSSRSYSNEQYSGIARNQQPFNPQLVVNELQNILNDDSAYTNVTVRFEDISANTTTRTLYNPTTSATSRSYSLLNYFYWPDGRTNRLANLQGAGTATEDKPWDYVIILGDPSLIANTPGVHAMGVKLLVDTIRQGTAEPILMMQWPHAGSSVPVSDFGEVTYRVGDSGGITVAPAGFAWDAYASKDSGTHPTADGAYLAAATLYNTILGRDAATDSTYTYQNGPTTSALATLANNTVQTHNTQSHYSGVYNQENPHKRLDDKDRVIRASGVSSSTEQGFLKYTPYANQRHVYGLLQPQLSLENYDDNPSDFSGIQHFYIGRNNPSGSTRYVVQPATYRTTYAFPFQIRNQDDPEGDGGLEMLYGIDTITGSYRGDTRTAFDLVSLNHVASGVRLLPIQTLWATAKDELGISSPFYSDGNHYGAAVNEAAAAYIMTHLTGRCPIGKNGTADERTRRSIGYEASWIMSTLNLRPPGFTTQPSSHTAKTVTPGTEETLSVYFVNPPESPVTVDVSVNASTAAIINPKTLTFDNTNHDTIQNVKVTGLPGSSAAEAFTVDFASTSTDMCFANLSDSWKYTNNRASTETLSVVNQSDRQESTSKNVNKIIDLQVSGSLESNTTLAQPFHGTLSWSGSDLIYTPDTDYIGSDTFAFAVNTGGTLTKGYIEITVEDLPSVVIVESGGSTAVSEGGATDTYTLQLSEAPASNVVVTITPDAEVTVSMTSVTFTTGDWSTPQTVTVTAVNDNDHEGFNHNGIITHSTSSSDPDWNAIAVNNVTVTITDNNNTSPGVDAGADQTVALAGTAWTPADINTVAWYDAMESNTITQSGGKVSQWNDKGATNGTPNNRHATQTTGTRQPTYQTSDSMVNNMPSIGDSGSSGQIGLVTPSMTARHVYVVTYYKDGLDASFDGYATLFSGGGSFGLYRVMANQLTDDFIGTSHFNDAGTYKNGATTSSLTEVLPMPATLFKFKSSASRTQTYALGFNQAEVARDWQGAYCEWIFTDGTEDANTENQIEGYLAHKWGIAENLPIDHPYKSAPPGDGLVTVNLDGTVIDPDDVPTTSWSMFSGPQGASVTFGDASAIDTTADFSVAGTYVLRLTADDGYGEVFDEVTITVNLAASALTVSISPASISENGGTATATVTRNSDTTDALTVTLVSNDTGEATVVSGDIPAGQASANFTITAVDDGDLDGTRTVTITASATDHSDGSDTIDITDDEVPATYTVSYNGNGNTGGTAPSNQTKTQNIDLTLATNSGSLVKTDHTFAGWNTASDGSGTNYAEEEIYSTDADLTLYAKWTYSGSGGATSITVGNHSFEEGGTGRGGAIDKAPWQKAGTGSNLIAIENATTLGTKIDTAPDASENFHYTNSTGDNIYQVLAATLAANSTYTLRVDVGDRNDLTAQAGSIRLGYVSSSPTSDDDYGLNLLTATVVNDTVPVNGAGASDGWQTWESTFTTGVSPDGLGQPLRIELVTAGAVQTLWDNVRLEVVSAPTNTLSSWLSGYSVGGFTGVGDDPDGDGIANGIENILGTDPSAPSSGLQVLGLTTGAGTTLTFTHPLNDNPASDLTAAYIWSRNLSTFHADGASDGSTTVSFVHGPPSGGMVTVTATITGPADRIFVALEVTQN